MIHSKLDGNIRVTELSRQLPTERKANILNRRHAVFLESLVIEGGADALAANIEMEALVAMRPYSPRSAYPSSSLPRKNGRHRAHC